MKSSVAPSRWFLFLQFAAFACFLFGIKLWLISNYGNETPYWDQWDAEAAFLYTPILNGQLSLHDLFAAHNEHRIFTTRVLALILLSVNGIWSPVLEMIVNAGLHIFALAISVWLLAKAGNRYIVFPLLLLAVVVFSLPFGWENSLAGFQAQFYLVLLFSVLCIWWMVSRPVFTARWWLGLLAGITAYFSLASGAFAFAAVAFVLFVRFFVISRERRELVAAVLLGCLFVACVLVTPVIAHHLPLRAHGFGQFIKALASVLAWPFSVEYLGSTIRPNSEMVQLVVTCAMAAARNLPLLVFIGCLLNRRVESGRPAWFILAFGVWLLGQAVAIAYGRAGDALASRYMDLHAMALLVNFAAICAICATARDWRRTLSLLLAAFWLTSVLLVVISAAQKKLPVALAAKHDSGIIQEANVRDYLSNGDVERFRKIPFHQIPYPDADRLAGLLNSSVIRSILPQNLQQPIKPISVENGVGSAFVLGGAYQSVPSCACEFWGSYGVGGDSIVGEILMRYGTENGSLMRGRAIKIKVAGYPTSAGRIEVIQGDSVKVLEFDKDPRETWVEKFVSIRPGPFSIRLIDTSPTAWLAVSLPVAAGRMDNWISVLLGYFASFLALALVIQGVLLISMIRPQVDNTAVVNRPPVP